MDFTGILQGPSAQEDLCFAGLENIQRIADYNPRRFYFRRSLLTKGHFERQAKHDDCREGADTNAMRRWAVREGTGRDTFCFGKRRG
ncbi:MAG: hypothetical protein WCK86_19590 [Planctomycetia bacterium]